MLPEQTIGDQVKALVRTLKIQTRAVLAAGKGERAVLSPHWCMRTDLDRTLRNMVEKTADAVFGVDPNGNIVCWNVAAENLFGFSAAEVMHKGCASLLEWHGHCGARICSQDCPIIYSALVLDERVPQFDAEFKMRSGKRVSVSITILPYKDRVTGTSVALHLCRDETDAKAKEELVKQIVSICATIQQPQQKPDRPSISLLTDQEKNVLRLLSMGRNPEKIARTLEISPRTLRNHISNVNRKLGTRGRLESVMHAIRTGLI